ncbi:MAG: Acyl-coenzyme A:6-aminopenicillanic acid acyl-transferase [Methanosaeta sp. PtaB.Bin087]|jgi:hypothetical protein|nr:MAG: Acyl-coenzyme A:6-aminopenicillanic acid acyl-transferase [Methanosaeta sp. PtaB.Bin087]HNT72681.1 C45 family autoproteolytic acyltransferase/hydrolase [Methanothrix sp.]HOI68253.1 C45 family autoproteolytic acyltransferase/hydrolase [Methanothrix sp.]HPY73087.1 C45 family autoproteolytic acyltransferase/hydrolase [Methanothrix sp.]
MRYEAMEKAELKVERGVKILRLAGSPYEMGYQHGRLLAKEIDLMVKTTLPATAAYVALQADSELDRAEEMLWIGQRRAEPHLPKELKVEMEGIADGVRDGGGRATLEEILLWNTNYDQWCIYCHPNFWSCSPGPDGGGVADEGDREGPAPLAPPAGGCSSFSAWDEGAGGGGELIFGKNEDNFNMPGQLECRMMVVAAPDDGFGHVFMTYPGMIGLDGGVNEAGFEMMTQLSSMRHETMAGCGIAVFTRLLLTRAKTVDDAVRILREYPRCAGIAYHVADGVAREAAVVETSSKRVCVRHPMDGVEALWQTNHSNCYPGWMGYSGYNMVRDQAPVNGLSDVSTIDRWQAGLRDPYNFFVQAPSRFERYGQLIHDHYGEITPEVAIEILSDRYDPYTRMVRPEGFPSWTNNILCTISALYPDFAYRAREPVGAFKAHIANMWSLVARPEGGDLWLAIRGFPAQRGGFEHFNLHDLLDEVP